ncbi:Rpr2-domain-containing protein [Thelephora terrestris]|uniref:Rpr2-domain-containing protein n=1 Tax=Thelephora terrestris TaxID=56493 RepID=A0A9P6HQ01_9AGAM|nr:Rpr2-domain-containing protein [Thelephora terrestris]
MAKKQRENAPPNPHSVPNREIMQRLNFLYQASTWLSSLPASKGDVTPTAEPSVPPVISSDSKGKKKQKPRVPPVTPAYLSRAYVSSMKAIGRKTVVKLDPSVKRTICKGCDALLIPGMTAIVRSKPSSSHKKMVRLSCVNCKTMRRIPAPPISQEVPESAMQVDGVEVEGKSRKRPKRNVVFKRPFFERPEHILFRGNEMVVNTDEDMPRETAPRESEPVRMEIDAVPIPIDG